MHGVAIVFLPFLLVIEMVYLFYGIRYKKSKKFRGRVVDSKGTEIVYLGGRFWDEIYETYEVVYYYKGQPHQGEVCTNRTGLKPGASVDVYVYDPKGKHEIETDIYWRKFIRFAAYGSFVIAICILMIFSIFAMQKNLENSRKERISYSHTYGYTDEEYEKIKKQTGEFLKEEYGYDTDNLNY